MNTFNRYIITVLAALLLVITPITGLLSHIAEAASAAPTPIMQQKFQQGERMYREGVLPSGEPMQAYVNGDVFIPGTAVTCVSCHLRSGLGSFEGGVVTPPTNGKSLNAPLDMKYKSVRVEDKYYPVQFKRPAYNDLSLAAALRGGVDSSGREMNPVMPRYNLNDPEMEILISYLKTLSESLPLGTTESTIKFATIISEDVNPETRDAFLVPLENYIRYKNNMADFYVKNKRSARMASAMLLQSKAEYVKVNLSKWILKGSPETWKGQLEEYYRKEPVFAILGGITNGDWQPVHMFCESNKLPALFPITELPVISDNDWYTLYISKGTYQEGEGAARYLNSLVLNNDSKIIQIVRNAPTGLALAKGFDATWQELGHSQVTKILLNSGERLTQDNLGKILNENHPTVLIVWDDAETIPGISSLASHLNKPDYIFVSTTYLGDSVSLFNDEIKDKLYLMYPYSLPKDESAKKIPLSLLTGSQKFTGDKELILKKVYSLTNILSLALMDMRGNHYRDYLLDVIGMQADQSPPLFERLSFGPGQRFASKGCYVVQLSKGSDLNYIKKSDWVIH